MTIGCDILRLPLCSWQNYWESEGFSRSAPLFFQPQLGSIVLQVVLFVFRCENKEEEKQRNVMIYFTVLLKVKTLKSRARIFADTDQFLKREVNCRSFPQHFLPGTAKVLEGMRRKRAATKNILMKVTEEGLLRAFLCLTSCVGYMCTEPIKEVLWHQYNTCVVDMEKKRR